MFARRIHDCWKTNYSGWRWMVLACVVLVISACAPLHAQFSYNDVYDFDCLPGECQPFDYGQLTLGLDGNLYGMTYGGGTLGFGTIFMVTPSGSSYTDLVQLDGTTTGKFPFGGLTRVGADFYGTTQNRMCLPIWRRQCCTKRGIICRTIRQGSGEQRGGHADTVFV